MPQAKEIASVAVEVLLETPPKGTCAVYIVEVRNRQEIREVKELFGSLEGELGVRQLAEGTVTAYAVQVPGQDLSILDEIELALKENYRFSISERAFQKTIHAVVCDLCEASDSVLRLLPTCGICEAPDPFPTTISFLDAAGLRVAEAHYCARCVASLGSISERELTMRLLAADRTGLAPLGRLRLKEQPKHRDAAAGFRNFAVEGLAAAI
ncbi:MAG: hypothetical protein GX774_10255 [Armatimonadetes bacterium]|jgi:hypothetical protein|nr:hypothetical protein [Armatimonadota bacterium]